MLSRFNQALVIRKEGYKEFSTTMSTTLNGWFFGNIVLGGLPGSTTDAATGAMHEYAPNQFLVALEPEGSNAATSIGLNTNVSEARPNT